MDPDVFLDPHSSRALASPRRKQEESEASFPRNSRTAVELAGRSHRRGTAGGRPASDSGGNRGGGANGIKQRKNCFLFHTSGAGGGGWGRMGYTCGSTWRGIMAISFKRMMSPQVRVSSNYIPAALDGIPEKYSCNEGFLPRGRGGNTGGAEGSRSFQRGPSSGPSDLFLTPRLLPRQENCPAYC